MILIYRYIPFAVMGPIQAAYTVGKARSTPE